MDGRMDELKHLDLISFKHMQNFKRPVCKTLACFLIFLLVKSRQMFPDANVCHYEPGHLSAAQSDIPGLVTHCFAALPPVLSRMSAGGVLGAAAQRSFLPDSGGFPGAAGERVAVLRPQVQPAQQPEPQQPGQRLHAHLPAVPGLRAPGETFPDRAKTFHCFYFPSLHFHFERGHEDEPSGQSDEIFRRALTRCLELRKRIVRPLFPKYLSHSGAIPTCA